MGTKAKIVDGILILAHQQLPDYQWEAVVNCEDYDEFRSLPKAIEINGHIYGRTGWNSDNCFAYYRSGALVGVARRS